MKAESLPLPPPEPPPFHPITVTLESVDEARMLWHLLNQSVDNIKAFKRKDLSPSVTKPNFDDTTSMWFALDAEMAARNLRHNS